MLATHSPAINGQSSSQSHILRHSARSSSQTFKMATLKPNMTNGTTVPPHGDSTAGPSRESPTINGKSPEANESSPDEHKMKSDTEDGRRRRTNGSKRQLEEERTQREERAQRKSTRIKGGEVTGTNYVDYTDLKQPRKVNPPVGGIRIPFHYPKNLIEQDKQMERLKINMVGPKTRDGPAATESDKFKRRPPGICVGEDFQASFDSIERFRMPSRQEREADTDRDVLMWKDNPALDAAHLEEAWVAIRKQSGGAIPIDAMLHRLLICNYDISEMLRQIELEQWEQLPQPFEPFTVGQRQEYERLLRKTGVASAKKFRLMQDKFLKTYWLGEIVAHYYLSKKKGCPTEEYNSCCCRERIESDDRGSGKVSRLECACCTQYVWDNKRRTPYKLCTVCSLYYKRTNQSRKVVAPLTGEEERIARRWRDVEERENDRKTFGLQFVLDSLEEERVAKAIEKARTNPDDIPTIHGRRNFRLEPEEFAERTAKAPQEILSTCPFHNPQMDNIRSAIMSEFTPAETMRAVQGFQMYGAKFSTVACFVGGKSEEEIKMFYVKNVKKYRLDYIHAPPSLSSSAKPPRSLSGSPEPNSQTSNRRKRADSADPDYESGQAPPPKSSRKTRSSGIGAKCADV